MRLDKFLKVSRIIKRRTLSKEMSESSRVKVNGKIAKPSTKLKIGDEIEIEFGRSILTIQVKELKDHVLKNDSSMLYEIISEKKKEETIEYEMHF
ncbi:MAG: RNA-binding S4 domain-containing protein [Coprobacillus sp.]|nr:RNA-binding S4 domain-containing protein [Coprobacillus sp.]MCI9093329.1 RNA-binding S4 domain-containing protein [Coprobacillus sp.]